MKRINFYTGLAAIYLILIGYSLNAQQILSHSVSHEITLDLPTCAASTGFTPGDNAYFRTYTPANFSFTGDFYIYGANFAMSLVDNNGINSPLNVAVNIYTSSVVFPGTMEELTLIASKTVAVTADDDNLTLIKVLFDSQIPIDANEEIVIQILAADGEPNSLEFRIAGNDLGENAYGYIVTPMCGLTEITPYAVFNELENMIIDLVGDENPVYTVEEETDENISIYPNPTNSELRISYNSDIEIKNISLLDATGRNTGIVLADDGTMDVSSLTNGIYILMFETDSGIFTRKVSKN